MRPHSHTSRSSGGLLSKPAPQHCACKLADPGPTTRKSWLPNPAIVSGSLEQNALSRSQYDVLARPSPVQGDQQRSSMTTRS